MIRPIVRMGDPVLVRPAAPVTAFDATLQTLVADMWETMAQAGGVGLAAPQVGIGLQVMVFGFDQAERYPDAPPVPRTVLVNPVIEPVGDAREGGWEGCLSIPGLRGWVPRWQRIRWRGHDVDGQAMEGEAAGFHARVIQHEYDHLHGVLYPMRIEDFSRFGFADVLFPQREAGATR
ncbi:peptide deformylase [Luteimonas yindakuii]|uniref:peptide deformylase n=1 Tax=Luteimonas yindakuii TaxID=2565782 RepID=UPI001420F830|nr:peptide deformylase [Luteimonas yindakuii]